MSDDLPTHSPWDEGLKRLEETYDCEIGKTVHNRIGIQRKAFLQVTNIPSRKASPEGIPMIVLRRSLQALDINFDEFVKPFRK